MKKLIFIGLMVWLGLNAFAKSVQANDYNTAVIGHIITQKVQGNNVDTSVLEGELERLMHLYALDMIDVILVPQKETATTQRGGRAARSNESTAGGGAFGAAPLFGL